MQTYLLSVMRPQGEPPPPEVMDGIRRDLEAFNKELKDADAWVFAGGLHDPSTATVVRPDEQGALVTDGPYAESKEFLGGVCIWRRVRCRS